MTVSETVITTTLSLITEQASTNERDEIRQPEPRFQDFSWTFIKTDFRTLVRVFLNQMCQFSFI